MSRQLLRMLRSIPLPKLQQGGTLAIQSSFPNTLVHIIPEWRDDGHLSLEQWLPVSDAEANATVTNEQDKLTSLGRMESHVSVNITPSPPKPFVNAAVEPSVTGSNPNPAGTSGSNMKKIITDDGVILPDSEEWNGPQFRRVEYSDGITHVTNKDSPSLHRQEEPCLTLTATVPEKLNLSCDLHAGGTITIDKKVEGDVHLYTASGDIRVSKLRGHIIHISTSNPYSTIYASDLLEAETLSISTPGRVRAKRIHGTHINIQVMQTKPLTGENDELEVTDVDDVGSLIDISSLYVTRHGSATVFVSSHAPPPNGRAIRIKSHHGHVAVETQLPHSTDSLDGITTPLVELRGVNGSCDVAVKSIDVDEHNSDTESIHDSRQMVHVHIDSLSPDSVSFITANQANMSVTLDRKVEADLRMVVSSHVTAFDPRTVLLEDDDSNVLFSALRQLDMSSEKVSKESRITVQTSAFTERDVVESFGAIDYVDGWVDNRSMEPDSRFDVKTKGGKINLDGAAAQALQGFDADKGSEPARPLLAVATDGNILVESLSWFGAIARQYGLEEDVRDLGRTASRAGRPLLPVEE